MQLALTEIRIAHKQATAFRFAHSAKSAWQDSQVYLPDPSADRDYLVRHAGDGYSVGEHLDLWICY